MIIRIIKNRKISQYLCRHNILGIPIDHKQYYQPSSVVQFSLIKEPVGFITSLHYYFSKDANGKGDKSQNKDQPQEEHKPKIIQITKQEYLGMKKFLEDITLSMPDPLRYASSSGQNEGIKQTQNTQDSKIETEVGTDYFSTVEQKLSFQLLKLSQPIQFLPIFRQYHQRDDTNLKLIILHRYCSISGCVSNQEGELGRLAYSYMVDILNKMRKLQQNQLELFLSLYIGLHQQIQNKKEFNNQNSRKFKNQLPKLLCSLDSLPLVENPSHSNNRLIVLLLQFYEIQIENNKNNEKNKIIVQILKHYEPPVGKESKVDETDERSQKQEKQWSQLKNLAYIGITAYTHNLQNHTAIPKLTYLINEKLKEQMTQNLNKQLIRTSQHILQNVYKLNHSSLTILNNMKLLQQTLIKFIVGSIKFTHQETKTGTSIQADDILQSSEQGTSGTIESMLYTTLLVLEQSKNKISRQWSLDIIKTILQNYKERKTQKINMAQLGELWKSCSIMYKLIKKEKQIKKQGDVIISTEKLLELVQNFINKTSIQEQVKIIINPNNNSVIQEYAYNIQAILFQCLVAYRVVLPPLNNYPLKDLTNISKQISSENNPNYRRVLMDLLSSYRKVCESLYACNLINDSNQPQIHNLLIVCMISQAYPIMLNSSESTQKISKYLLSPTILELLKHFGVSHPKYGNYGKIIVQKYD